MKNIVFYVRLVKCLCYLLIPSIIIGFLIKWLSPIVLAGDPHILGLFLTYSFDSFAIQSVATMPFLHRLAGMAVDGIEMGIFLTILWLVAAIMKKIEDNQTFSSSTVALFTSMSKYTLILALYTPLNRMLLSAITTLHSHRIITASFGSTDLFNIFLFGFCMVITLLMQQASVLQNDQNLTV